MSSGFTSRPSYSSTSPRLQDPIARAARAGLPRRAGERGIAPRPGAVIDAHGLVLPRSRRYRTWWARARSRASARGRRGGAGRPRRPFGCWAVLAAVRFEGILGGDHGRTVGFDRTAPTGCTLCYGLPAAALPASGSKGSFREGLSRCLGAPVLVCLTLSNARVQVNARQGSPRRSRRTRRKRGIHHGEHGVHGVKAGHKGVVILRSRLAAIRHRPWRLRRIAAIRLSSVASVTSVVDPSAYPSCPSCASW